MQFDRSKFKKTSIDQVSEMTAKANATMIRSGNSEYTQFVKLEEGENIFRVLPCIKGSAYTTLKTSKLKVEVDKYDENGAKVGTEIKDKNIFCADIHGTKLLQGKDPINIYISYVNRLAEDIQDSKEREKFLNPIRGYRSKKAWVWGIEPILAYVCYVTSKDFDGIRKLQLRPAWLRKMKEISIEQSEEETLCMDIFSDSENGYPLKISVKKNGNKTEYSVSAVLPKKGQSWDDFFEENMVSDETLETLSEMQSLQDLYIDIYSAKDFKMALDGLRRFDDEAGYNIFADDAFLEEIEALAALIPDEEDEENKENEENKPSKPQKKTEKKFGNVLSSYPPLIKMKAFLRDYVEQEYEGTQELPNLSSEEVREWYDLAKKGKMLPFPEEDEDQEENEESEPVDNENEEDSVAESTRARISALRARINAKN